MKGITEQAGVIRRRPEQDAKLARAVRALHETGPRLVVELEAEIERLQRQLAAVQGQSRTTTPSPGPGAELVGLLRG